MVGVRQPCGDAVGIMFVVGDSLLASETPTPQCWVNLCDDGFAVAEAIGKLTLGPKSARLTSTGGPEKAQNRPPLDSDFRNSA